MFAQKMAFLSFCLMSAFLAFPSFASPAMTGPTCAVEGTVGSITERKEENAPETWRKQYGLSKYREYTDVRLSVKNSSMLDPGMTGEDCSKERLEKITFQLRPTIIGWARIKVGDTISAKTEFSGDEFSIGNWLYDVSVR